MNTADAVGTVRVIVQLYDTKGQRAVKGNRLRVVTVREARVTEVAAKVARALLVVSRVSVRPTFRAVGNPE